MADETFYIGDDDRYSRLRLIPWWEQEKLADAHVLVVGAGALGNEVLKNLALLGVGQLYVLDFDLIESSNLTRAVLFRRQDQGRAKAEVAAEAIREMNPDVRVKAWRANVLTEVGLGLVREMDVVIGCLDNREARLWVNRMCWKTTTPWIDGGIQEIAGVVKVFVPPDSACYECAMTENDYRLINLRYSCPLLRQEDLIAGKVPTAPTISSMIGGLQTQEALKLIHGISDIYGEALVYNGAGNRFYRTRFQRREDCLSHDTYPEPVEAPLRAEANTVADLMAIAADELGEGPYRLTLDRDLVVSIECANCDASRPVMRPLPEVGMSQAICPKCGEMARPTIVHEIPARSPGGDEWGEYTLAQVGIPAYDIVRVANAHREQVILLAGDRESVMLV